MSYIYDISSLRVKPLIYTSPVDFEQDLIVCIVEAAATWHL